MPNKIRNWFEMNFRHFVNIKGPNFFPNVWKLIDKEKIATSILIKIPENITEILFI